MTASLELCLIDPKINLRVDKNTPLERFVYATRLTKQGLGFPQYSNDDIVIPGLVQLGYDYEDACNYTVAACWEFIVPNCGMDIPNICAMNFPGIIRQVMEEKLLQCDTFAQLMEAVEIGLQEECDRIIARCNQTTLRPAPYMSILIDGCLEQRQDVSVIGAKYNNYGVHGAGIANGADALAAVKMQVFDHKRIGKEELLQALAADFEGYVPLRNLLLESPKMGNNDEEADDIACQLMEMFASYLNHKPNGVGGIYRAGTGSAMEYIWSAETVGATADGRKAGAPYGSSFSPSLTTRLNGPLSVIQSFTKYDMRKIINGGPLTMEVHDATFRNEAGIEKVAGLVRTFILLGGHQLQLNAINRERLLDAQANPEKYPNLIVRVWGWSGYFRELDVPYQNHIIQRTEFTI